MKIQADVRRQLRAPAPADFPARYGQGTGHIGDRIYPVVGLVDAQNGFGALLRASFPRKDSGLSGRWVVAHLGTCC
ncbi:MAG: hypothetical protein AAFQ12_09600 [Pseudomonadota bacterium]